MNELTRAELIEMICPTDATYDCNQGNCSSSCDKCEDILNYLLDRYDAKVRADAIEECCKQISERVNYWDSCAKAMEKGSNEYKIFISLAKNFDELAEQLKEQK